MRQILEPGVLTASGNRIIRASAALPPTSYSNPGGSGDRTGILTASTNVPLDLGTNTSAGFDGDFTYDLTHCFIMTAVPSSGYYIRVDFGAANTKHITELKLTKSDANSQGTWQFQGSTDSINWVNIGSPFAWSDAVTTVDLTGNNNYYRYYQMLGISGSTNGLEGILELEFKL